MEMLYNLAGWRTPLVLVNVSRGLSAPITLEPDHNDILAARDSGFLQLHCATCQEVLDSVLFGYRLAEDMRVRLPVLVNLDGFYLSFTREPVMIPTQNQVRAFLPPFDPGRNRFRGGEPVSQAVAVLGGGAYSYFRYQAHLAALEAKQVFAEISADFNTHFGRAFDVIETYRCEDAEILFVMMGSFATKAREAVDRLRTDGQKVGLLRPRLLRPFPAQEFVRMLSGRAGVAVVDQNLSTGLGGILHTEIAAALYHVPQRPILASYIGGLGGRDITASEFYAMVKEVREAVTAGRVPPPRLLFTEQELQTVRGLQRIAGGEEQDR
jgi:pyruvate ferredoxin oxidoreductase alpha subunit